MKPLNYHDAYRIPQEELEKFRDEKFWKEMKKADQEEFGYFRIMLPEARTLYVIVHVFLEWETVALFTQKTYPTQEEVDYVFRTFFWFDEVVVQFAGHQFRGTQGHYVRLWHKRKGDKDLLPGVKLIRNHVWKRQQSCLT